MTGGYRQLIPQELHPLIGGLGGESLAQERSQLSPVFPASVYGDEPLVLGQALEPLHVGGHHIGEDFVEFLCGAVNLQVSAVFGAESPVGQVGGLDRTTRTGHVAPAQVSLGQVALEGQLYIQKAQVNLLPPPRCAHGPSGQRGCPQ